jgi:hypothetical protein
LQADDKLPIHGVLICVLTRSDLVQFRSSVLRGSQHNLSTESLNAYVTPAGLLSRGPDETLETERELDSGLRHAGMKNIFMGLPANEYLWFRFLPRGAAYDSPGSEERHPGVVTPTRTSSYPAGVA